MRIWAFLFSCVLFASTTTAPNNDPYRIKAHYTARDRVAYAKQVMLSAILFKKDHNIPMGDTKVEAVGKDSTVLFIEDYKAARYNWPILTYKNDIVKQGLIKRGFKRIIFEFTEGKICIYNLETDTIHFQDLVDVSYKHGWYNGRICKQPREATKI